MESDKQKLDEHESVKERRYMSPPSCKIDVARYNEFINSAEPQVSSIGWLEAAKGGERDAGG